jgi:hypothetical protein
MTRLEDAGVCPYVLAVGVASVAAQETFSAFGCCSYANGGVRVEGESLF